jgi:hypothetical protein
MLARACASCSSGRARRSVIRTLFSVARGLRYKEIESEPIALESPTG